MSNLVDTIRAAEALTAGGGSVTALRENLGHGRAMMRLQHMRPKAWKQNAQTGLMEPDYRWIGSQIGLVIDPESAELLHEETSWNVITNVGRVYLHSQGYSVASGAAAGFSFIGLSNDTLTETAASTTLSTEIAANGLTRAGGTVTLATGAGNQTTVARTFTCATAPQAAQKAALFTAVSAGTMNHVIAFTQRSLIVGDTLAITFTITLG